MGISIYKYENDTYVPVSDDLTSPISTVHDGKNGTTRVLQLFLRNDDSDLWYSNIKISPEDTENAYPYGDVVYSETGWGIKLIAQESQPTVAEWEDKEWGDFIWMENIGSDSSADISTYFSFWYLISSPPNINADNKSDINLDVAYTENAVV